MPAPSVSKKHDANWLECCDAVIAHMWTWFCFLLTCLNFVSIWWVRNLLCWPVPPNCSVWYQIVVDQSHFAPVCTVFTLLVQRLKQCFSASVPRHSGCHECCAMVVIPEQYSTLWVKKTVHYNIVHNFVKCWPIFKFFSLADSLVNMQHNHH